MVLQKSGAPSMRPQEYKAVFKEQKDEGRPLLKALSKSWEEVGFLERGQ